MFLKKYIVQRDIQVKDECIQYSGKNSVLLLSRMIKSRKYEPVSNFN